MGIEVALEFPKGVRANAVMEFLQRGHGYSWKTVSKEPVHMVLGHPAKIDHPEIVILNDSLIVNSSNEHIQLRMEAMLDVLARQVKNGLGGGV